MYQNSNNPAASFSSITQQFGGNPSICAPPIMTILYRPDIGTPLAQRIYQEDGKVHYKFIWVLFDYGRRGQADMITTDLSKEVIYAYEHVCRSAKYDEIAQLRDLATTHSEDAYRRFITAHAQVDFGYQCQKLEIIKLPRSQVSQIQFDTSAIPVENGIAINAPVICPLHNRPFEHIDYRARNTHQRVQEQLRQENQDYEDYVRQLHQGFEQLYQLYKDKKNWK
ncbi:hypothetical protein BDA99DRAFT_583655 [Phascolomyces articulosus]|uniref:Uncharacterized protein n=1 Tax=Phascolomyces articulosus TaxID=60185 RepID=A0AAD5PCH0_9FUNG|nr:hypothetical protein BDA99DRAFT_583655 [Phascolomyces articulosus]